MSYHPAIKTKSDAAWVVNGLRFETVYECEQYLEDLKSRWFALTETTILKSDEPATYVWRGDRCWPVQHDPEVE